MPVYAKHGVTRPDGKRFKLGEKFFEVTIRIPVIEGESVAKAKHRLRLALRAAYPKFEQETTWEEDSFC